MKNPALSIIVPAYNSEGYIGETLHSLLNQTFADFELIVIDNASTDMTTDIVASFDDSRIRLLRNAQNMGVAYSANRGIKEAKGKYMARADADDLYPTHRLQLQWSFMEANPDITAVSSSLRYIGARDGVQPLPVNHDAIKAHLLFYTSLAQPVVMLRRDFFIANNIRYDESKSFPEDYELWMRMAHEHGARFANIAEPLIHYRVHQTSMSNTKSEYAQAAVTRVQERRLHAWGLAPDAEDMRLHSLLCSGFGTRDAETVDAAYRWLLRLEEANRVRPEYAHDPWQAILSLQFLKVVGANLHMGPKLCRRLATFPGFHFLGLGRAFMEELFETAIRHAAANEVRSPVSGYAATLQQQENDQRLP